MNAIVSICHFCELHGPNVVFCTQAFRDLLDLDALAEVGASDILNPEESQDEEHLKVKLYDHKSVFATLFSYYVWCVRYCIPQAQPIQLNSGEHSCEGILTQVWQPNLYRYCSYVIQQ